MTAEISGWAEVAWAQSEIEANLIIGKLAEAGIEARSVKSRSAPGAWMTGSESTWTPATVLVPTERTSDAQAVLAEHPDNEWEPEDFEQDEPEVIARPGGRSAWFWVALIVVVAMLAVLIQSTLDFLRI